MNSQPETIPIQAALHLPAKGIWALIWQRAQQNAFLYKQEFDVTGEKIKREVTSKLFTRTHLPVVKPDQPISRPDQLTPQPTYFTIDLPLDSEGHAYLSIKDQNTETLTLISQLVKQFFMHMGSYPAVIYLCNERWAYCEQLQYFRTPDNILIPYALVNADEDYDVCCKSLPLQG